jgi:DNA modification methylase
MTHIINQETGENWAAINGDCVETMQGMDPESVHLTVTSIPFATMFCYSDQERDFGNCRSHTEFYGQMKFWADALLRVTKSGRLACIHLMNLPTLKTRDGFIGLIDFRGEIIRLMQAAGWIYCSEVTVWKCPVMAVTRTHALGLLYKQLRKDSTMSRMGIPDYVVMFRKPGENAERVAHTVEEFPVDQWQKWASPVWMDVDQGKTLNVRVAREEKDELHLCALQTEVIERCIGLYSNPGDVVFDPFGGIGSTPYVALQMRRRGLMTELKGSYFQQAVANLRSVEVVDRQMSIFDMAGAAQIQDAHAGHAQ